MQQFVFVNVRVYVLRSRKHTHITYIYVCVCVSNVSHSWLVSWLTLLLEMESYSTLFVLHELMGSWRRSQTHTHTHKYTHIHTLNLRISRARATAAGSLSYLAARARQIEHSSRGARAWSHDALAHTHIRQATEPHIRVRRGVFLIKTPGKHIIIYGAWCPGRIR